MAEAGSAFTDEATDTILTWIANERELYEQLTEIVKLGMLVEGVSNVWRTGRYPQWCEAALLKHSQIMAEWMDDPECDLNDYLVNPAEVDWQAIWDHFAQQLAQA